MRTRNDNDTKTRTPRSRARELVRRADDRPLVTDERNGLRVLRLNPRSTKVTKALVDRLSKD